MGTTGPSARKKATADNSEQLVIDTDALSDGERVTACASNPKQHHGYVQLD